MFYDRLSNSASLIASHIGVQEVTSHINRVFLVDVHALVHIHHHISCQSLSDGSQYIGDTRIGVQHFLANHWGRVVDREVLQIVFQVEETKGSNAPVSGEAHSCGACAILQRLVSQTRIHHDYLVFVELEAVQLFHTSKAVRPGVEFLIDTQAGIAATVDVLGQIREGRDAQLVTCCLLHHQGVGVIEGSHFQPDQAVASILFLDHVEGRLRVGDGFFVTEVGNPASAGVLPIQVDLTSQ